MAACIALLVSEEAGIDRLGRGILECVDEAPPVVRPDRPQDRQVTCASVPWTVIPLVVTDVQSFIAAGQVRTEEQLIDAAKTGAPGTLTVFLQPLFEGGIDRVTPGSSCIANAYTNNHDRLSDPDIGFWKWLGTARGRHRQRRARINPAFADAYVSHQGLADIDGSRPVSERRAARSAHCPADRDALGGQARIARHWSR
ncbi:hypothetical protein [Hyphomicrobium sp.]|uniref:hypothetical protein n=1 Tax=Hyphomicrobium sp. TaxID=82 RepID=UPI003FA5D799